MTVIIPVAIVGQSAGGAGSVGWRPLLAPRSGTPVFGTLGAPPPAAEPLPLAGETTPAAPLVPWGLVPAVWSRAGVPAIGRGTVGVIALLPPVATLPDARVLAG